ncbi:MAG: retropepsin-like aspartic protease [Acidobacteriota bacterium]
MAQQLSFEHLIYYDPGLSGITIAVSLKSFEKDVSFTAKVDTGASYCIFERKHGEALGLNIEGGLVQPISTATGRFITYGHEVTLSVAGFEFDSMVYFAADDEITRNVLGRHGWLDRVVLGLIDYEGKLLLSRYNV